MSEREEVKGAGAAPRLTPRKAREFVDALSPEELAVLAAEVNRRLKDASSGESGSTTGWDYQRQTWGSGWLQRDPKVRRNKDGSERVYGYWYFHWIEDGKRRSRYIGGNDALAEWKETNPR